MYKALYSHTNADKNVLSFKPADEFNLIEQIDEHWWSMLSTNGITGLVPASYLEINKISQKDVLKSIDESIKLIHNSGNTVWNETVRRNIQKLMVNREAISSGKSLWTNPTAEIPHQPKRLAPQAPVNSIKKGKSTKRYSAPLPPGFKDAAPTSPRQLDASSEVNAPNNGASSKIYNIQVNKGDISPLNTKQPSKRNSSESSNESLTSPTGRHQVYLPSSGKKDQVNTAKSTTTKDVKLKVIEGSNITISRMGETSFKTIRSDENVKSKQVDNLMQKSPSTKNTESFSFVPHDTISRDSFASSEMSTITSKSLLQQDTECYVPEDLGKQLIDAVRGRCKMSFNKSLAAVRCVLQTIGNEVPSISEPLKKIIKQIQDDKLNVFQGSLAEEDANRLYDVLNQLTEHKEDSQQRNWAIHEDFLVIKELLENLMSIMDEIDPSICRSVLEEDEYRYINDLILYYQMESRSKLRISLLHAFGCFCQLGKQFLSQLLCSVLPTELAQDMLQDQADIFKFVSSSFLLTMLFSTGEPVPYHHYVQFNEDFIEFVLNQIEDPPDADREDEVADGLVGLLLSYNLHFKTTRVNTVMQVMSRRNVFRTLSEKVLLLLNRENDPTALFEFNDRCPDSVVKFLMDVFADTKTSGMFFTNDLYVLFDIILRQLTDRQKKDRVRTEYLSLFHSILNTTHYHEHKHRSQEFKRCFSEILSNRETESEVDVYIVREIMTRFAKSFS